MSFFISRKCLHKTSFLLHFQHVQICAKLQLFRLMSKLNVFIYHLNNKNFAYNIESVIKLYFYSLIMCQFYFSHSVCANFMLYLSILNHILIPKSILIQYLNTKQKHEKKTNNLGVPLRVGLYVAMFSRGK